MYCFLSFVSYFIFIDFFFISKLFNYWLFVLSLQNPFLQVEQIECSDGPSVLLNLSGSKMTHSFWIYISVFCIQFSTCFFFSCLSLIASKLPKYLCIFLHSTHVSNQIFLFTNYFSSSTLSIVYFSSTHLSFFLHSLCIIDYWLTNPPLSHSFMVWFFKHLNPSVIHLLQTSLFIDCSFLVYGLLCVNSFRFNR